MVVEPMKENNNRNVITITGFLDFIHRLESRKEHNVSETGSVSVLR
jgi:hypothetical protein